MECSHCHKAINRRLYKTSKNHFCGASCAASFNNKNRQKKKKPVYYCSSCGNQVSKKTVKLCKTCSLQKSTTEIVKHTTVGQLKLLYKDKNALAFAAKIRGYGKTIYDKSNKPKHCSVCGYDKHYEVCHIKSISSFDDNATMLEVHSLDNMIALCPNCHWEFDHGLLTL